MREDDDRTMVCGLEGDVGGALVFAAVDCINA